MIKGEGIETIPGVTSKDVFDFVLDPAQYTKADTKIIDVRKICDIDGGMIAREDGKFMGLFPGSVITKYQWDEPHRIDVTLVHGVPKRIHAWFEIDDVEGGTRLRHVEEVDMGRGPLGSLHDLLIGRWWQASVRKEVSEISRLMQEGERGRGLDAIAGDPGLG
ncbi:MAG: SRPBCC family protein [Actinomycetota bacterium]